MRLLWSNLHKNQYDPEKHYLCLMLIVKRESTNPFFNLAAEEYLLHHIQEPCFMLWQNTPAVVIGKHQNPFKEVDLAYLYANKIPVIRRISGGGTVYHDLGNINYSFINFGKQSSLVNFDKYSQPIRSFLNEIGVEAYLHGKSDLKIAGKKFSGNASHVYKNSVLHHGTLLYDSNLTILNDSIKMESSSIIDKSINSNRSQVVNIKDFVKQDMKTSDFMEQLEQYIFKEFEETEYYQLSKHEKEEIEKLSIEKYKSWEWNFGYTPNFTILQNITWKAMVLELSIKVSKGLIQHIEVNKESFVELDEYLNSFLQKPFDIDLFSPSELSASL